jgi:hypothetical protein
MSVTAGNALGTMAYAVVGTGCSREFTLRLYHGFNRKFGQTVTVYVTSCECSLLEARSTLYHTLTAPAAPEFQ